MRIGTVIIPGPMDKICPNNCIPTDGSWYTKDKYPELYEIFKNCKCLKPTVDEVTGIIDCAVKGIFHLPKGNAWIVYKEGM